MLLVEAFYPKNRGQWKQFSSYVPDEKEASASARKASFYLFCGTAVIHVSQRKAPSWARETNRLTTSPAPVLRPFDTFLRRFRSSIFVECAGASGRCPSQEGLL